MQLVCSSNLTNHGNDSLGRGVSVYREASWVWSCLFLHVGDKISGMEDKNSLG